jgi:hypothetical protein
VVLSTGVHSTAQYLLTGGHLLLLQTTEPLLLGGGHNLRLSLSLGFCAKVFKTTEQKIGTIYKVAIVDRIVVGKARYV